MSEGVEENDWWPEIAYGTYKVGGAPSDAKNAEEIDFAYFSFIFIFLKIFYLHNAS